MLLIIFIVLLEEMFWLALLIVIHFKELLPIMNLVKEINYVIFLMMMVM